MTAHNTKGIRVIEKSCNKIISKCYSFARQVYISSVLLDFQQAYKQEKKWLNGSKRRKMQVKYENLEVIGAWRATSPEDTPWRPLVPMYHILDTKELPELRNGGYWSLWPYKHFDKVVQGSCTSEPHSFSPAGVSLSDKTFLAKPYYCLVYGKENGYEYIPRTVCNERRDKEQQRRKTIVMDMFDKKEKMEWAALVDAADAMWLVNPWDTKAAMLRAAIAYSVIKDSFDGEEYYKEAMEDFERLRKI